MRRLIALDLDGVVANSFVGIRNYIKRHFKETIAMEQISHWDYLQNRYGRDATLQIFRAMWTQWNKVPLMEPKAIKYANMLTKFGNVFLVTGRQDFADIKNVTNWLATSGLNLSGILTINIVDRYNTGFDKTAFSPPFNIFIDDSPKTIINVIKAGAIGYLRNQPWNQRMPLEIEADADFMRVNSLQEVVVDLRRRFG